MALSEPGLRKRFFVSRRPPSRRRRRMAGGLPAIGDARAAYAVRHSGAPRPVCARGAKGTAKNRADFEENMVEGPRF